MAKVYISSTYEDLKEYREAAYRALRRLGHDAVAMEDYVATGQHTPLNQCLDDVDACDCYLGIFAWKYGYIPDEENPEGKSITELEYRRAQWSQKPRFIFLLKKGTPWLPEQMDGITGQGENGRYIKQLRQDLEKNKLVNFFSTPDELASLVSAAVGKWEKDLLSSNKELEGLSKRQQKPIYNAQGELVCPYQGLLAFTQKERPFFFGRQAVVEALEKKLNQRKNFIPLIGASGSGKSSVLLAGLIPWLEELGWQILEPIKPGTYPLTELEFGLRALLSQEKDLVHNCIHDYQSGEGLKPLLNRFSNQRKLLLVVDQFEELFTFALPEQRDRFINLITQVADFPDSPLAVVTTMRADFLEPCLPYDSLRQLIQNNAEYLPTLGGLDLIEAITEPAKRQGYEVTKDLLNQILEDIKQEPGFLPLLEFALTQLWQKRDEAEHQLTLEDYQAIGGMVGALNCHADKVYRYRDYERDISQDERTDEEKVLIKRIFLNLLQIGDGEKDTRLRQPKAVILSLAGDNKEEQKVLKELIESKQGLVKGRLLVTGGSEGERNAWVDLAHESLIEGWTKLNVWRTENREGRKLADKVEKDAKDWVDHGKDQDFLWQGYRLAEAEKILSEYATTVPLSPLAQKFLQASSQQELRDYLRSPKVDDLDREGLEKEAARKSFLTKEKLRDLLKDEKEDPQARLAASWLLEQWGEEMPMRKAEVDGEGNITLLVIEEENLPTTVVEDLGDGISLEMVEILGGEFSMGSSEEEEGSNRWERPQHKVKVSPFLIGRYPVTQAQWRAVASLTQVERDLNLDPSNFKGDSRPVEQVSWYEAVEFCQRLSRATGKEYRLPSEAEWEYACRAIYPPLAPPLEGGGAYPPYHFGEKISPALANYIEGARGRTTTVRRFQVANSFGLYDMHGNVWEWCEDDWHNNYEGAPTDGSAWLDENENRSQYRLLRGGSWNNNPQYCRSASRNYNDPVNAINLFGLRVVASSRT